MHLIIDCTTTQNQVKYNGIGQYTKHIVSRILNKKDIDISLLMFDGESTLDPYIKGKNVQIHRLGKVRPSDYKNIFLYLFKILPAIKKLKRDDSIYFCPYFWIGIPSLHIPTVLMVHDFILPIYNIYSEQNFLFNIIRRIQYWMEMYKARYCKAIITNSKCTTKDFRKYFPRYPKEKIYTIYLDGELKISKDITGWDESLPKDYKERGYFIYMGGTPATNKNSEGVVKGYREFLTKVKHDISAPYLVIAGKNFTKNDGLAIRFREKVRCLGIKNIVYTGLYKDEHAKPLLENSISFVHLSVYEGFGIALVEAMKAGTPVIAHNGSCYPEVLKDAGMLVNGLKPKEVGEAMYKIYTDSKFRENLITIGLMRGMEFSWNKTVDMTLEVFKSVNV